MSTSTLLSCLLLLLVCNVSALYEFFPDATVEPVSYPRQNTMCAIVQQPSKTGPRRLFCWGVNSFDGELGWKRNSFDGLSNNECERVKHYYGTYFFPLEPELPMCGPDSSCYVGMEPSVPRAQRYADFGINPATLEPYNVRLAAAGNQFNCAVLETNEVVCFGSDNYGTAQRIPAKNEVEYEEIYIERVDLGTNSTITDLTCQRYHCCALFDIGKIKCWGNNDYGQLGYGDTNTRGFGYSDTMGEFLDFVDMGSDVPKIVKVVSSGRHSFCALFENQRVKCWGTRDHAGYAGRVRDQHVGDEPNEMGDFLPYLDLRDDPTSETEAHILVEKIVSMNTGYCVLYNQGYNVRCWGNRNGLGYGGGPGDSYPMFSGFLRDAELNFHTGPFELYGGTVPCVIDIGRDDRPVMCWSFGGAWQWSMYGENFMGYKPYTAVPSHPAIGRLQEIIQGNDFICFLFQNQILKCQGRAETGVLGRVHPENGDVSDFSGQTTEFNFADGNPFRLPDECEIDWRSEQLNPDEVGDNLYPVRIDLCPMNSTYNHNHIVPQCQCLELDGQLEYSESCIPVTNCINGECHRGSCSGVTGNGYCSTCNPTFTGATCEIPITCNLKNGLCEAGTCYGPDAPGTCTSCLTGYYGTNCDKQVGCLYNDGGVCNKGTCQGPSPETTGECDSCLEKFHNRNCSALVTCERDVARCDEGTCWGPNGSGKCDECKNGLIGENCDSCEGLGTPCSFPGTVGCTSDGQCLCGMEWNGEFCQIPPDLEQAQRSATLLFTMTGVVGSSAVVVAIAFVLRAAATGVKKNEDEQDGTKNNGKTNKKPVGVAFPAGDENGKRNSLQTDEKVKLDDEPAYRAYPALSL